MPNIPRNWRSCEICKTIPGRVNELIKGGDLQTLPLPEAVSQLLVVATPFSNADSDTSNWCLRKCPRCGTFYSWGCSYEWFFNGAEYEIQLTRLPRREGRRLERWCLAAAAAAEKKFHDDAMARGAAFLSHDDRVAAKRDVSTLLQGQRQGFDISFAVAAALEALVAYAGKPHHRDSLVFDLKWFLEIYAKKNPRNAGLLLDLLRGVVAAPFPAEVVELTRTCSKGQHAQQAFAPDATSKVFVEVDCATFRES